MVSWVLSGSSPTITPAHTAEQTDTRINRSTFKNDDTLHSTMDRHLNCLPGDPANTENGGTTVSGGSTVLSSTLLQSFRIQERD